MSGNAPDNFEQRLRRGRLAGPPAALADRILSAAPPSPPHSCPRAGTWLALATGLVVAATAAINSAIDSSGPSGPAPVSPICIAVQPPMPGLSSLMVCRPQAPAPVDWKTLQKERHDLEAMIGS